MKREAAIITAAALGLACGEDAMPLPLRWVLESERGAACGIGAQVDADGVSYRSQSCQGPDDAAQEIRTLPRNEFASLEAAFAALPSEGHSPSPTCEADGLNWGVTIGSSVSTGTTYWSDCLATRSDHLASPLEEARQAVWAAASQELR